MPLHCFSASHGMGGRLIGFARYLPLLSMECGSGLTRAAWPVAVRSIRLIVPSPIFGSHVAGRFGGFVAMILIPTLMNAASSGAAPLIRKTMI
jgi:hypothetical protein